MSLKTHKSTLSEIWYKIYVKYINLKIDIHFNQASQVALVVKNPLTHAGDY